MRGKIQRFDPRQTMRRPNYEVFHYKDPRPSDVAVHHHDFYEVFFFLSGQVEYRVEGSIYYLQPGDLLLINPMELHQLIVKEGDSAYERVVLWIDRGFLESFSDERESLTRCFDNTISTHTNLLHLTQTQQADVTERLERLVRESYGGGYGSSLCAHGLLLQLMVELNRMALCTSGVRDDRVESSPLVTQVLAYIGEHYNEPLTLDGLAQRFYVSKYHLSHEFSRIVGTGVYHYILLKRLLIARQMLADGIAPSVVSVNCGFGDYANFYRAFKAQYGVTPSDYARSGR
ncbi:MAG: AraC family transcriptional regulator [Oscillospiraceae bacterium]